MKPISQSSRDGASPSDSLMSFPRHSLVVVLPLSRDAVGIFYCPSRLVCSKLSNDCNILICMQKHSQHNNDERTQFYRKIYLSHFIRKGCERVMCELETEQNCNILTSSSSGYSSTSFSFSWAAQPGTLRAVSPQSGAGSHTGIPSPKLWVQLTEPPVAPGYIIVRRPPASCGRHICTQPNPSTVKVIPWYFRPDAPVIYTGAFLIGRVGGQYVTWWAWSAFRWVTN